jgi:hypothetical protein
MEEDISSRRRGDGRNSSPLRTTSPARCLNSTRLGLRFHRSSGEASPRCIYASASCWGSSRTGNTSAALLRIEGSAIAAQVLMYCGATAYTWKTAFDPKYAK